MAEQRRERCGHRAVHEGEAGVPLSPFATKTAFEVDPRDGNRTLRQCELDQALPPIQAALDGGGGRGSALHAVLPQGASDRRGGVQAPQWEERLGARIVFD